MTKVFISYRREDSEFASDSLYNKLVEHFGKGEIFKDVDCIPLGVDFVEYLDGKVSQCQMLLVVIGNQWLSVTDERGERRLDNPRDFVRIEVESGLKRNIPTIPLLLGSTPFPKANELPESISALTRRNGMWIRSGRDFNHDTDKLIRELDSFFKRKTDTVEQPVTKLINFVSKLDHSTKEGPAGTEEIEQNAAIESPVAKLRNPEYFEDRLFELLPHFRKKFFYSSEQTLEISMKAREISKKRKSYWFSPYAEVYVDIMVMRHRWWNEGLWKELEQELRLLANELEERFGFSKMKIELTSKVTSIREKGTRDYTDTVKIQKNKYLAEYYDDLEKAKGGKKNFIFCLQSTVKICDVLCSLLSDYLKDVSIEFSAHLSVVNS